jgi:membrane protease YdiL (CAAX protease family)
VRAGEPAEVRRVDEVIVRAAACGLAVSFLGVTVWGGIGGFPGLAGLNLRILPQVPWAIVPMTLFLVVYLRYLNGAGWPRSTSAARRANLRANPLSGDLWPMSLFAGFIGLAALVPLSTVMGRLFAMPADSQHIEIPAAMPPVTVFLLVVMSSIVAGVVEESGFRGYLQGPIERRYGFAVAFAVSGTLFGLAHFTHHVALTLQMLPFYLAVSAIYGGLTYATNSILPGMVLHAGGDVWGLTRQWMTGQPPWQLSPTPAPVLIWETGIDAAFVTSVVAFLLLAAIATWAIAGVAREARRASAATRTISSTRPAAVSSPAASDLPSV